MAIENYVGSAMVKAGLAVLGKISVTTFVLTVGTAAGAVLAAGLLAAQMADFETSDEKKQKADQS